MSIGAMTDEVESVKSMHAVNRSTKTLAQKCETGDIVPRSIALTEFRTIFDEQSMRNRKVNIIDEREKWKLRVNSLVHCYFHFLCGWHRTWSHVAAQMITIGRHYVHWKFLWRSIIFSFSINFMFLIEIDIFLFLFLLGTRTITHKEFRIPFANETAKSLLFLFKKSTRSHNICFLCRRSTCQRLRLISIFVAVICACVFVYAANVYAFNEFNDAFNFRKTSAFNSTLNRKFISWCLNFAASVVQIERTIPSS